MRYRARCNAWTAKCTLRINEAILSEAIVIVQKRVDRSGHSLVVQWVHLSEPKAKTSSEKRNGRVVGGEVL